MRLLLSIFCLFLGHKLSYSNIHDVHNGYNHKHKQYDVVCKRCGRTIHCR